MEEINGRTLSTVRLQKQGWLKSLFYSMTEPCFYFPVVYTDGLVSSRKKDVHGRKPFGIWADGKIICLEDAPEAVSLAQAEEYCKKIHFAGHCASVGNLDWMVKLNRQVTDFNKQVTVLGGRPFVNDCYWTKDLSRNKRRYSITVRMDGPQPCEIGTGRKKYPRLRPIIDVKDASTLL